MTGTEGRKIWRADGEDVREADDLLIVERKVCLLLAGEECARTVMTPGQEDLWALGHLRCLGAIETKDDVERLEIVEGGAAVLVRLRARRAPEVPPGGRGEEGGGAAPSPSSPGDARRVIASVRGGVRWLAEAPLYVSTGAAHAAALVRLDGTRLVRVEDIGRHNAVDKAIGWAVQNGVDLGGAILLTSGRLPEDMAAKGVAAGVPVMASVSAATAGGAALAERHGLTLIGFVRGERMNIYTDYSFISSASSFRVLKPAKDLR